MIVEFGNTAAHRGIDDQPKVTTVHIPEADEQGLGGYTHDIGGISVDEFRSHRADALDYRNGVTQLPGHEALLSIIGAWPSQGTDRPNWIKVIEHELTPAGVAEDIEKFLREFYKIEDDKPADVEQTHHTRFGPPGVTPPDPQLPDLKALYLNGGRVLSNVNDGGGQVGVSGTGTAATATSLTTASTFTTNQWAGYRVYAMQTATGPLIWGNILSNTNAAGASVLTVDRWYAAATPGGAAATAPSAGYYFLIADGGQVSAWFIALSTTSGFTPASTDTTMTGEYTTASGGFIRKISPYAQTSGTSPRSITLTPVYTGNGSDTYPSSFYGMSAHTSMVTGSVGCMKFETALSASATVAASGDQITVTETITGS